MDLDPSSQGRHREAQEYPGGGKVGQCKPSLRLLKEENWDFSPDHFTLDNLGKESKAGRVKIPLLCAQLRSHQEYSQEPQEMD